MAKKNLVETVNVVASKATKCATKKRSRSMKEIISQMRKMANEKWQIVERSGRYRRCALQKSYQSVANDIEETLMDGIFISLKEHSMKKSGNVQKRQLRRIVEKRHAQAVHHLLGHSKEAFASRMVEEYTSRSMAAIHLKQICV